jgi:Binding-protein-dependent transport system inner membrane component
MSAAPGGRRLPLILVILLPLLTSVVVRTFAWIVILGRQGIVNAALLELGLIASPLRLLYTEGGMVVALAQVQIPLMVLPLITALSRLDPNLLDASSALGAGHWRTLRKVMLPLTFPGIIAGCLLTYAAAITALHNSDAGRRRTDAIHAHIHLPAVVDPQQLAVRGRDLHHLPRCRIGGVECIQRLGQTLEGIRASVDGRGGSLLRVRSAEL